MSTSPISFRRRARRSALALMMSAILVPASSALAQGDTKYDLLGTTPVSAGSGDTPADFPGMPGTPPTRRPVASHAPEASGFDWTSAGVGAGAAGVLILVSLGGATAASRLRFGRVQS